MEFYSAYDQGFARIAACTIPVAIADPVGNAATVIEQVRVCHDDSVAVAVFPELCLTGYAVDDLHLQDAHLDAVQAALADIAEATRDLLPVVVVGAPLRHGHRLFNCAVTIHRGSILGVTPKSLIPNYREFYEKRHFASGAGMRGTVHVAGQQAPFGDDLLYAAEDLPGLVLHTEVCEDMWVPVPPSSRAALGGATVLTNLSGSPITVGRAGVRSTLCQAQSARCLAAYVYAASGQGESTTDLSWDGMTMVYECGGLLGKSERFPDGPRRTVVDVDLDRIRQERMRDGSLDDNARMLGVEVLGSGPAGRVGEPPGASRIEGYRTIGFRLDPPRTDIGLRRKIDRFPFVPDHPERLAQDCFEAYNIQIAGLVQRLRAIGDPKVVIGVSGGLDSTHALIVAAHAMDRMGRPRSDVLAYTMPGFATGEASKDNATRLAHDLGVTFAEMDIRPAARQMLADLDHPFARGEKVYDTTFENVQAGLRTDYLFRIANHETGIVLGTGDLSELALGWCTYGVGDQMSHYGINTGIPKTMIQHLIRWVIDSEQFPRDVLDTLESIIDAEISPELVPADGGQVQSTEAMIGPYTLQDFTLFHVLRYGFRPGRIAFMALHSWGDAEAGDWPAGYPQGRRTAYDLGQIRHWLTVFGGRFFGFSQFKRTAMPSGPKVVAGGSLSPRGDWRAPSDGNARAWLAALERDVPNS